MDEIFHPIQSRGLYLNEIFIASPSAIFVVDDTSAILTFTFILT